MKHLLILMLIGMGWAWGSLAEARSIVSPWDPSSQQEFQSLVYASSTTVDVQRVLGPPDEIVRTEQMAPVLENHYYYDESGSGAATLFVFENGLLMGMHYMAPDHQLVDLTYFLTNNGDRRLTGPYVGGIGGYAPTFPLYGMGFW